VSRQHWIFLARGLISALLIWWLVTRLDIADLSLDLLQPRWYLLLAAFAIYALSAFGGAWQWTWILRLAQLQVPAQELRRLYFIGLFFNNFLPANIGGDAYKIVDLGRQYHQPLKVFCATLLDRLLGLSALTLLALLVAATALILDIPLTNLVWLLVAVLLLLWLVLGLLLSRRIGPRLPPLLERLGMRRLAPRVARVVCEFHLYRAHPGRLIAIFFFSLAVQFLRILTHVVVGLGLGIALDVGQMVQLFVLVPMLAISLTLPITINGIGLRESVSAQLLTFTGLSAAIVVALEVVAYFVQVIFSLYGGLLFWWGRRATPARDREAD